MYLKCNFLISAENILGTSQKPFVSYLNTTHEKSSFELVVMIVQNTHKTYNPILFPLLGTQKWKVSYY